MTEPFTKLVIDVEPTMFNGLESHKQGVFNVNE